MERAMAWRISIALLSAGTAGKAKRIAAFAHLLAIHIADYSAAGHTISGDIEIAPAMAN